MSGPSSGCGFLMSVVVHGDLALNEQEKELNQRLKRLYPAVNEQETPLPRSWSPKDKFSYIGLSQNNLRVHYKGHGKTPKDAASVRATHPIPAACGVYYFEVKIISKGRDGYMGIGLSAQGVNMNRLPGIAFTDLPPNLYPTVGLQTPGEVVDANFGQHPFVFDIEDYMREWRTKIQAQIDRFPIGEREGEWQAMIQKMVASYLVHHSYCATAEAFAKSTDQAVHEELASIKNRQKIQKLVLSGRMGEAIETTQQLYPSLLERNQDLLFMLKVRQFIEMVNGTDSEVRCLGGRSPKSQDSYPGSPRLFNSPVHKASSSQTYQTGFDSNYCNGVSSSKGHTSAHSHKSCPPTMPSPELGVLNGSRGQQTNVSAEVEMELDHFSNGVSESSSNGFLNGSSTHGIDLEECDGDMEVDSAQSKRQLCGGSQAAIERMIQFGRELQSMSEHLRRERGKNSANKKMLKDAFSLLAYSDPWSSPVGYQLDSIQREPVCSTLNSAILETHNLPKQPPLALSVGQAAQCLSLMARTGSGSCAFASVDDYLH
uniref:RAN binding protein 9 n=1 Tax=Cyprinus carpio TaxID=7962 RepID=A0A8C1RQS0_CYPCA